MSASVLAATTRISAFSSLTASRTISTYLLPLTALASSTLHTYITGLEVSRNNSLAIFCSSLLSNCTVRADLPCSNASLYLTSTSYVCLAALSPPVCACFCTFWIRLSMVSKSFSWSSVSMISLSRTGSTLPSTWVTFSSSKQRSTCKIASVSRILAKNLFPNPSPLLAPFTRPAISTISTVVGTMRPGWTSSASLVKRSSGTVITPTFGSIVQKGKLAAWAFAFDKQLKSVDFPTFGRPTMPHCKAIIYLFFWLLSINLPAKITILFLSCFILKIELAWSYEKRQSSRLPFCLKFYEKC